MKSLIIVCIAILFCFATPANSQSLEFSGTGLNNLVFNTADDAIGYGDYLIVSTAEEELLFYDVSDPENPDLVASTGNVESFGKLLIYDNWLYTEGSHVVFDISDPANLVGASGHCPRGRLSVVTDATGHDYLISDYGLGSDINVYDIMSDPVNLPFVTTIDVEPIFSSLLTGHLNYIVYIYYTGQYYNNEINVQVVDASDIMNLQFLPLNDPIYTGDYGAEDVYMRDGAIYIRGTTSTWIFDPSDGSHVTSLTDDRMILIDDLLIAERLSSSRIYSLQNPLDPVIVGTTPHQFDFIIDHSAENRLAFVVSYGGESPVGWLNLIDLSDPANLVLTPNDIVFGQPGSVFANESAVWTIINDNGLVVRYDNGLFIEETHIFHSTSTKEIVLQEEFLYMTIDDNMIFDEGIITVDISDPLTPEILDYDPTDVSMSYSQPAGLMTSNGSHLFVSGYESMNVYDLSTPQNPQFLIELPDWEREIGLIAAEGNILYTIEHDLDELNMYDISNPVSPTLIATELFEIQHSRDKFKLDQSRIAAVRLDEPNHFRGNIILIDAIDPRNLQIAYEFDHFNRRSWEISFDFEGDLFFIGLEDAIRVYDVSDLYNPVALTSAESVFWPSSIAAAGDKVYARIDNLLYEYTYSPVGVSLQLVEGNVIIPAVGGDVTYEAIVDNPEPAPVAGQGWVNVTTPNGNDFQTFRSALTVPSGVSTFSNLTQTVPSFAPSGQYLLTANLSIYLNNVVSSDSFGFTKTGEATGGRQHWTHSDWQPEIAGAEAAPTEDLPTVITLSEALPNPFNPSTTITLALPEAANVKAVIYNINGREVTTLINSRMVEGTHALNWTPSNLASGLYFVRASVNGNLLPAKKMVYLR
jgi:hypothetical protein